MRLLPGSPAALLVLLAVLPRPAAAQSLTRADSALVGRILLAEDRRDTTDEALGAGLAHADARVRELSRRALGRIRDPKFTARDGLAPVAPPPIWVEPAWRIRYRRLPGLRDDCSALRLAVADSAWPVRLRAADLARASCAGDEALVQTFIRWVKTLPRDPSRRRKGEVAWQAAAHAMVALARLRPSEADLYLGRISGDPEWHLRLYGARTAEILGDSTKLRQLVLDRDNNVAEAAIVALSRMTGHADDALYLAAIKRQGAQVVRAAAIALKGSPHPGAAAAALGEFERFVSRANASERDVRVALLDAAGRPATDDRPPPASVTLPRDAVAIALGRAVRLRVTLAGSSGGGAFVVRLRGDVAPMTAARVLELVRRRYYDGMSWHRVEADFVIQGGSPDDNEYVGSAQYLRDELGNVSHVRGTVGMSTRSHDTGDAQWFVNLRDNPRLDGDYTVWAEVVEGIAILDGILEGDVIQNIRVVRR